MPYLSSLRASPSPTTNLVRGGSVKSVACVKSNLQHQFSSANHNSCNVSGTSSSGIIKLVLSRTSSGHNDNESYATNSGLGRQKVKLSSLKTSSRVLRSCEDHDQLIDSSSNNKDISSDHHNNNNNNINGSNKETIEGGGGYGNVVRLSDIPFSSKKDTIEHNHIHQITNLTRQNGHSDQSSFAQQSRCNGGLLGESSLGTNYNYDLDRKQSTVSNKSQQSNSSVNDRNDSITPVSMSGHRHHHTITPRTSFSLKSHNGSVSTPSPGNYSDDKRYSFVHEIKAVSPGKSLGGVFYCSSVVTRKNSSESSQQNSRETSCLRRESCYYPIKQACGVDMIDDYTSNRKDDRKLSTTLSGNKEKKANNLNNALHPSTPVSLTNCSENNNHINNSDNLDNPIERERKFCAYFKWYNWMSKRDEWSLFLFPPDNRIRLNCIYMTEHKCFDYVILMFISLNCITLAMERSKIPPWSFEREFLTAANYVFTIVFAIEMALKVIASGLWYGESAYFKSGWNIMDGMLVGVSLLDLFLSLVAQKSPRIFGILRVFRLLRSLRPLR